MLLNLRAAVRPLLALAFATLGGLASVPGAQANLIANGSFETFSNAGNGTCASTPQVVGSNLTGWITASTYTFDLTTTDYGNFTPLKADNGNCTALGLQSSITASPDGGSFIAADASYENGSQYTIATQPITGLMVGMTYNVTFSMGAGQQTGFSGPSADWWVVGLGSTAGTGASQTTNPISLPNGGFSGWFGQEMTFLATATSEVLWFFGQSTANSGQPPFVLLDGVSMSLPEPPSSALLMAAVIVLFGVIRWRFRR